MTSWRAPRAEAPVAARVHLPGSKSETARALLLAALAEGPSRVHGALDSRDTSLMRAGLSALGARIDTDGDALVVTPTSTVRAGATVDCGLAGTVMRFLPPIAALSHGVTRFTGDVEASARPMAPLLEALRRLGVTVSCDDRPDALPFTIDASGLTIPDRVEVDASASSQFLSALLLAAPLWERDVIVATTGPLVSAPHVRMTVHALRERGIDITEVAAPAPTHAWSIRPGRPRAVDARITPDLSNAGPFLAAGVVTGGEIRVADWPRETTQAGDAWRDILPLFGATVRRDGDDLVATGPAGGVHCGAGVLDLSAVGELAPTVAALAATATTPTTLTGIAHLRGHETDRLHALATEITRLGGRVEERADGLHVDPAPLHGARLRSWADHRMATFGAVVGLVTDDVEVEDLEVATTKTLPDFSRMWSEMLTGEGGGDA